MTTGAASAAVFQIANPPGGTVYFDMSPYLTSVTPTTDGKAIDTTTFGKRYHTYIGGQNDLKISVEGIYEAAVGTVLATLHNLRTITGYKYYPQGTAGNLWLGSAISTSYSPPAKLDEAVTFAAEFQNAGTVTFS